MSAFSTSRGGGHAEGVGLIHAVWRKVTLETPPLRKMVGPGILRGIRVNPA